MNQLFMLILISNILTEMQPLCTRQYFIYKNIMRKLKHYLYCFMKYIVLDSACPFIGMFT